MLPRNACECGEVHFTRRRCSSRPCRFNETTSRAGAMTRPRHSAARAAGGSVAAGVAGDAALVEARIADRLAVLAVAAGQDGAAFQTLQVVGIPGGELAALVATDGQRVYPRDGMVFAVVGVESDDMEQAGVWHGGLVFGLGQV